MRRSRGLVLFLVLIVVAILFVLVGAMTAIGLGNLDLTYQDGRDRQAYYAAVAGAQTMVKTLQATPTYSPSPSNPPTTYTVMPNGFGQYSVQVVNNYNGTANALAPHNVTVPPGMVYVLSYGQDPGGSRTRQVGVLLQADNLFQYGVFGKNSIKITGGSGIDSYNSSVASYAATPVATRQDTNNLTIATNGTSVAVLALNGSNTTVYGSALVGPGANVNSAIKLTGGATVGGDQGTLNAQINLPNVSPPTVSSPGGSMPTSGTVSPGKYTSLSLNAGKTITLKANSSTDNIYYITGDVKLTGNSTIKIDSSNGPVKLYFGGSFDISGGTLVNTTVIPSNFQIYGTATTASVSSASSLTGGSSAAYVFYAPNSDVTISGGGDVYGAVIGNSVDDKGGSGIHYDIALSQLNGGATFAVGGWMRF